MTRKGSKRKPNGNGAAQGHGSVSVSIEAAASFFEAAQHAGARPTWPVTCLQACARAVAPVACRAGSTRPSTERLALLRA